MTAVSLMNPYAPQPVASISDENGFAAVQTTQPSTKTKDSNGAGLSSDHSGQGAGNGTGTGGAQLATLLKKQRGDMPVQRPTPESVVEAQSDSDPATAFLARQAELKIEAQAAAETRAARRAAQQTADAQEKTAEAAQPEFVMPNPLPTAPILQEKKT